jgi:hypothetical protein
VTEVSNDENIEFDVNDITMVPLREIAEEMGYTVKWNNEDRTVEINKGAQWTSITIDKNSYFKNKMAPKALSSAPIIIEGRTMVPAEFFTEIFDKGVSINNGEISFNDEMIAMHSGYIKEINKDEKGNISLTISNKIDSNDVMDEIIIHTNEDTIFNKKIVKGEFINTICPPIMTMSIPAQTSALIVY